MRTCVIVAAVAALAAAAPLADQSCPNSRLPFDDRMALLTSTNNLRDHAENGEPIRLAGNAVLPPAARPLLPMEWDCDLERSAQAVADTCLFKHSNNPNFGENLWQASSDLPLSIDGSGMKAFDSWISTISGLKSEDMIMRESDSAAFPATQMLWEATTRMGCGAAMCEGNRVFLVCHYEDKGNKLGDRVYDLDPEYAKLNAIDMRAANEEPIEVIGGDVIVPNTPEDNVFVDPQATADEFVPARETGATEQPTTTDLYEGFEEGGSLTDTEDESFPNEGFVSNALKEALISDMEDEQGFEKEGSVAATTDASLPAAIVPEEEGAFIEKDKPIFDKDGNLIALESTDQGVIIDNFSSDKNQGFIPEAIDGGDNNEDGDEEGSLEPLEGGVEDFTDLPTATGEPTGTEEPIIMPIFEGVVV